MKNLTSLVINCFFTAILSVSMLICFSTAFNIETNHFLLICAAILFSVTISLISYNIDSGKKFTGAIAVIQVVYIAVFILNYSNIVSQLNYAANWVLSVYSRYMDVPSSVNFASVSGIGAKATDATVLFIFLLFIVCEIISVSLIRLKKSILIYITSLIILAPCFIMVTTLPSVTPLIITVSILLALYITGYTRKYSKKTGSIILSVTSVVIAITLSILCAVFPLEYYERYEWQDNMLNSLNEIMEISTDNNNELASKLKNLKTDIQDSQKLSNLGKFRLDRNAVLSVLNEESGTVYLKKMAYADYEDNEWRVLSKDEAKKYPDDFNVFDITSSDDENLKKLHLKALYREDLIYTTYYSKTTEYGAVGDTCIENIDNVKEYLIEYYPSNSENLIKNQSEKIDEYEKFVYDTYIKLPDKTKEKLLKIADENGLSNLSANEIPQAVKSFIITCGEYSLVPDNMPEGSDFAPWFIESNSKGYCVHYATSTTTMLRALGIPARYVTGYFAPTQKNKYVDITNCNSHAWVEYYDKSIGWVVLDPTPPVYLDNANGGSDNIKSTGSSNSTAQTEPSASSVTEQSTTKEKKSEDTSNNFKNKNNAIHIPAIVWVIFTIVLIISAIFMRMRIIQKNRRKLFTNGENKRRIINIYRYALSINRITEGFIPIDVQNLVSEAKYSNHTMSDKAVETVMRYAEHERKLLYKNTKGIKKLYYRYIRVL